MIEFFTPTTIIIGSVVGYALGMFWYSPALFMNTWLDGLGMNREQLPKRTAGYMWQTMIYTFLVTVVMCTVLALFLDATQVTSLANAIKLALLLCFGFIVTIKFTDMLYTFSGPFYGVRAQKVFFVQAGYYVAMFVLTTIAMYYTAVFMQ